MSKYITVTETAKLVRAALKEAFPKVKFSVRSKSYSGGASITVGWVDGPTSKSVDAIVKKFEGASFDGMTDLKSYHDSELNGEKVHFGANYVFTSRAFSVAFLQRRADKVARTYGGELVTVVANKWGSPELVGGNERWSTSTFTFRDLVMQEAYKTGQA